MLLGVFRYGVGRYAGSAAGAEAGFVDLLGRDLCQGFFADGYIKTPARCGGLRAVCEIALVGVAAERAKLSLAWLHLYLLRVATWVLSGLQADPGCFAGWR